MCLNVFRKSIILSLVSLLLAACGGGSDGGSGGTKEVTISGRVVFDRVPFQESTAALDYASTTAEPVRGASVQLVGSEDNLLSSTKTDANGNYQLTAPANTRVRVKVLAELVESSTASWDIKVTDNTANNILHYTQGSLSNSGNSNSTRDLHAESGWVNDEYSEVRVAAPFAILDTVYKTLALLKNADLDIIIPPVELRWSENNRAVSGSKVNGEIESSHYDSEEKQMYILGSANNDTDEFDESVIVHEFGHYLEDVLSRADSMGGDHTEGDALDMRIAFGEGWGNAFAGMVLDDPIYRDSIGLNQQASGGPYFSVEEMPSTIIGWFVEASVQALLYDIFDNSTDENGDDLALGFAPLYQALRNTDYINSAAFVGIHLFIDILKRELDSTQLAALDVLLEAHEISVEDEFATNESNDGDTEDVLPLYLSLSMGSNIEVCTNKEWGEHNKLGNRRYFLVDFPDTEARTFEYLTPDRNSGEVHAYVAFHYQGESLGYWEIETTNSRDELEFAPPQPGLYVLEYYEHENVSDGDSATGGRFCATIGVN